MKKLIGSFLCSLAIFGSLISLPKLDREDKPIETAHADVASMSMLDTSIVPNASYVIYEGAQTCRGGVPSDSRYATFYTFDGNPLITVEHYLDFTGITQKLDPNAQRPQPTTYKITHWPAISILLVLKKGCGRDVILFFDKNGNRIDVYSHNRTDNTITVSSNTISLEELLKNDTHFPLDLSIVQNATTKADLALYSLADTQHAIIFSVGCLALGSLLLASL